MSDGLQQLGDIFKNREPSKKPPAHPWQDLALRIIKELNVPNFKRNSVFKICKDYPERFVVQAFNDTKELCSGKDKWKYFFKVISKQSNKNL